MYNSGFCTCELNHNVYVRYNKAVQAFKYVNFSRIYKYGSKENNQSRSYRMGR